MHDGQTHYGNIHGSPVFWNGPDVGAHLRVGREQPPEGLHVQPGAPAGRGQSEEERVSAAARHAGRHAGAVGQRQQGRHRHPLGGRAARRRRQPAARREGHRAGARRAGRDAHALDERAVRRSAIGSACSPSSTRRSSPAARCSSPTYGDDEPRADLSRGRRAAPTTVPADYYVAVYGLAPDRAGAGRSSIRIATT